MRIFCSGIGGIGLSAYASLQKAAGHSVSGSDRTQTALTDDLQSRGIDVSFDQSGAALPDDCDLLVYTEAVAPEAPERKLAAERGIRSLTYFQALGELSRGYTVIAMCGTHGKSSTTAMAARLLIEAGLDPTVVVGTKVRELDGRNFRVGKSTYFVLEACEYRRSFHALSPTIALMTNVDGDHFDAFGSIAEYQQAFVDFLRKIPDHGAVITHGKDLDCMRVARESTRTIIDADDLSLPTVSTPGTHMQQNAQLVLRLAIELGIDEAKAREILGGFKGTWRRLEELGTRKDGVTVIDDYAHHPAEIRASLQGIKSAYSGRRLVVAFQPHTHDRTLALYDDFTTAFKDADLVIVPNVYAARSESDRAQVAVPALVADIAQKSGITCLDGHSLAATLERLQTELLQPGDVVVTMGAGDITNLSKQLMA